jgi:hypothetical protein
MVYFKERYVEHFFILRKQIWYFSLTTIKEITYPIEISVHSHAGDRTEVAIAKARAIIKEMAKTVRRKKTMKKIPHSTEWGIIFMVFFV